MSRPCRQPTVSDLVKFYSADVVESAIDERARKDSKQGKGFVTGLLSIGAFIVLEAVKGSINHELCTPLKSHSKLPNYNYSATEAAEVN
jgi:hypothetical protein